MATHFESSGFSPATLLLAPVPLHTFLQLYSRTTKTVQCTADGEIHLALTQLLDHPQVFKIPAAAGVCHGYTAPLGQLRDELLIHAALQALVVGRVYQELGAVWLESFDGL